MPSPQPFAGIEVVEFGQFIAVPYFAADRGLAIQGKEAKLFLDQRGEAKPNSKPLILILRQL